VSGSDELPFWERNWGLALMLLALLGSALVLGLSFAYAVWRVGQEVGLWR
jgi:hypothetical protein